jgi:hypothetical protein
MFGIILEGMFWIVREERLRQLVQVSAFEGGC